MSNDKPEIDLVDYAACCAGRPPGFEVVYRFVQAIETGHQPSAEDSRRIAEALKETLRTENLPDGLHAFARSMQLKQQRGYKRDFTTEQNEVDIVIRVMRLEGCGFSRTSAQKKIAKTLTDKDALRKVKALYAKHETEAREILTNPF